MKKINFLIVVLVITLISTTLSFGASPSNATIKAPDYGDRVAVLYDHRIYDEEKAPDPNMPIQRWHGAIILSKFMSSLSSEWKADGSIQFSDVPTNSSLLKHFQMVSSNGIMRPIAANPLDGLDIFGYNEAMNLQAYVTCLLRVMGYGYNDSIQEFNWNNAYDVAVSIGLVTKEELAELRKHRTFTYQDMIHLTYNAVILCANNPYTPEYLTDLMAKNPPSAEVTKFINESKSKRSDFKKTTFKYVTVYHTGSEQAIKCIDLIKPHIDKVYVMLQDLWGGIQPAFDIYLIENEAQLQSQTKDLNDGIYKNSKITYVWLEPDQDADGNNLGELVQEMSNVFFDHAAGISQNLLTYTSKDLPWALRANSMVVGSIYTKHNYGGKVDQYSLYETPLLRINLRDSEQLITLGKINNDQLYRDYLVYYYSKSILTDRDFEYSGWMKKLVLPDTKAIKMSTASGLPETLPPMPKSILELDKSFVQ